MQARRAAILGYRELVEEPANRSYPRLDEVEWELAWEYARMGHAGRARRVALQLLADHPDSPCVSRVYFLLGAMFSTEAADDPSRYVLAEQAFAKAAGSPDGPLASAALHRLEDAARRAGDTTAADDAARRLAAGPASDSGVASRGRGVRAHDSPVPARRSFPPAAAPVGCGKDTDCKGDRICEDAKCVAPPQ